MKILCLIDTLDFGGGAERQIAGLAGLLHEKKYEVVLASYHKHNREKMIYERYGIKSELIECGNSFYKKLFSVLKFIQKGNFDVVIAYKDGATMIACLCKIIGCKFKLIVSERNTTQKMTFRERLKFMLYRVADVIVPNSQSQGEFIKNKFPYLINKLNVITNFVDTNLFKPAVNHSYSSTRKILVVGRINPQKNIEKFINVVRLLKKNSVPVSFDWYGGVYVNTEKYAEFIQQHYKEIDISDYLTFKGDTPNISDVYKQYDIFCLPSLYEGFPNVICEAMSSGKPILCSKVCDNPTIVEDGVNGFLFNPFDEYDMYNVIKKIIYTDTSVLAKMGSKSREMAEKNFSEEAFVQKYIKLIEN